MTDDLRHSWKDHWDFATPVYLNHGSFGLTPTAIHKLKAQCEAELNRDRDEFFWFSGGPKLESARLAVASFVNAPPDDLVLVDHVTEALNSVLKSLRFGPGDELLIISHSYPPYESLYKEFCRRTGAKLVVADVPFPVEGPEEVVAAITGKASTRTKLAVIDHITSPTALLLPIAAIVRALKERGVETFVDGAHGIGHVPLDMQEIGAAYYASNNHKWLSAPLASGFLYVRPDCQLEIMPAAGSLMADSEHKFTERFIWQGTKDPCARLCLPETISTIGALHPEGWPGICRRNHALALVARELVCEGLGLAPACPGEMVPCMFSLPLGDLRFDPAWAALAPHMRLNGLMRERHGYGVNCVYWGGQYLLRLTAYLYNSLADYERLVRDLRPVLDELRA